MILQKRPLSNTTIVHRLRGFYHHSTWSQKQKRGRFTSKAYDTVARKLISRWKQRSSQGVEKGKTVAPHCTVFYGDTGCGFGTKIKGRIKRSTERLQLHLKSKSDVISTKEYLSSKLCCFCDSPVKHGFSLRGRDKNAAVNILKIALYKTAISGDYPAFSATTSSRTTTTATADQLTQYLFGHNTSWNWKMNDSPLRWMGPL
ncbi:hypothetical protein BC941DRAFT_471939 [Chlamydoabsidia padenii]|nr:hypothetical protein BC941DRAFT_471939 [Chlamydoabsidia padenii]